MQKSKSLTKVQSKKTGNILGWVVSFGVLFSLAFLYRKRILKAPPRRTRRKAAIYQGPRRARADFKPLDIEIRYQTEVDVEAVSLAENVIKIIKMVLNPIESQIREEEANLIVVFCGDFWEMRMKNSTDELKESVRNLLEAEAW